MSTATPALAVTEDDDPLVEICIEDQKWNRAVDDLNAIATKTANAVLQALELDPDRYAISLLATDDDRIAALNDAFRGKAGPTNVLSWPAFPLAPDTPGAVPPGPPQNPNPGRLPLGDIALALDTCTREAKAAELPLKNHVTHLILHGILHVLGFDHETESDAARMEGIEQAILDGFGISDPYA